MENKEEKTRKEKKHSGLKVFLTTLLVILILTKTLFFRRFGKDRRRRDSLFNILAEGGQAL